MIHYKWTKLSLFAALLGTMSVQGADAPMKGLTFGGNFEGGYAVGFTSSSSPYGSRTDQMFTVDYLTLKVTAEISDRVKVFFNNMTSIVPNGNANAAMAPNTAFNTRSYFSSAVLAGGTMALANDSAYVQFKASDGVFIDVGHMRTPFGMENMWDRYDMKSYYYSTGISMAQALGWNYDIGAKLTLSEVIPGTLEFSVVDGRNSGSLPAASAAAIAAALGPAAPPGAAAALGFTGLAANDNIVPGVMARYHIDVKSGDWTLTPTFSVLTRRWRGGPADLGFTAGAAFKMGVIGVNAEFVYASFKPGSAGSDPKFKVWSIKGEPSVDLGVVDVMGFIDFANYDANGTSKSYVNFGAGLAKTYADKFRVRLLFVNQNGYGGTFAAAPAGTNLKANEIRLLVGTKF